MVLGCAAMTAPNVFSESSGSAYAQEKRSYWVDQFESEYAKWTKMLDTQIARNKVYPSDVKRGRDALTKAIAGLTRDGHVPAPYQARMDAYFGTVQSRIDKAALVGKRNAISRKIPRVTPGPQVEKIPMGVPTFCGDIVTKMAQSRRAAGSSLALPTYGSQIKIEDVVTAALFACSDSSYGPIQQWSQAYRQRISNLTGFTLAQNEALFAYATRSYEVPKPQGYRGRGSVGGRIPDLPRCQKHPVNKSGLAEERISRNLERTLLKCKGGTRLGFEVGLNLKFANQAYPLWVIDTAKGPTTEIARAGLVKKLITNRVYENALYDPRVIKNPDVLIQNYALARTVSMSTPALEKEIKALGLSEAYEWQLRFRSYEIHQSMRNIKAFTNAWLKDNPQYKAVVIDGPEAAVAENRKLLADNKVLLDTILAIEDRIDPKKAGGLNGCAEALYPHLTTWLKAKAKKDKVKSVKTLNFDDYQGSVLLYGLYFCAHGDATTPGMAWALRSSYFRTLVQHGPLSAAYGGMLSAFNDASEKQSKASTFSSSRRGSGPKVDFSKLTWNPVSRPDAPRDLFLSENLGNQTGVIKSVKKSGDRVVFHFKTVKYRVPTYNCKDTRRISYIQSNGIVHYKQNCVKTGSREVKETNDPVSMPTWAVEGIKKNMSMTYVAGQDRYKRGKKKAGPVRGGYPKEVYKSQKQKKLVALLGVKL